MTGGELQESKVHLMTALLIRIRFELARNSSGNVCENGALSLAIGFIIGIIRITKAWR